MNGLLPFDVCESRHGGNAESREANLAVAPTKVQSRKQVVEFIRSRGFIGATLDECSVALGKPPNALSGRLTEAVLLGQVFKTEMRRKTRSGCSARVYIARHERIA